MVEVMDRHTDVGYAEYLQRQLGDRIVLVSEKEGYWFDERTAIWARRSAAWIQSNITKVLSKPVNLLYKIAVRDQKRELKKVRSRVNSFLNSRNVYNQSFAMLSRRKDQLLEKLDVDEDSLPIMGNKVICLRSGETRTRTKDDFWSFWLPVAYKHQPEYPNAQKFIRSIFVTDEEKEQKDFSMEEHVQITGGYFLTGRTDERVFWNPTGTGRNGKTTFFGIFQAILGPLYCVAHRDLFMKHRQSSGGAEPHKAMLRGKRLAILAETNNDDVIDQEIKHLIDENPMLSARDLYEGGKSCTFKVYAKLGVCSNPPLRFHVDGHDQSVKQRLRVIKFLFSFVREVKGPYDRPMDSAFVASVRNEYLSELFSFFVDGAKKWYAQGRIPDHPRVTAATEALISHNDNVTRFFTTQLVKLPDETDDKMGLTTDQLFSQYETWCTAQGLEPMSVREFVGIMKTKCTQKRATTVNLFDNNKRPYKWFVQFKWTQ